MPKLSGSPNYKMADISRLLALVEDYLPLGKDEWERLTDAYNAARTRNCVERDMDSLRRKFKALYGVRKPTGTAEMPPHIERSKLLKRAIDEKANVVEMDDEADEDEDDNKKDGGTEIFVEPDFSFEPYYEDQECHATDMLLTSDSTTDQFVDRDATDQVVTDGVNPEVDLHLQTPNLLVGSTVVDLQVGAEGLEAYSSSQKAPLATVGPAKRQLRSTVLKKINAPITSRGSTSSIATSSTAPRGTKLPAARGFEPGSRDEDEAYRHITLQSVSNRLGGVDLYKFRDTVANKRGRDVEDASESEASFAKAKRIRALKTTTALKQKLTDLERTGTNLAGNTFEMMLMFREESERKAETRRLEEDQRRRDDAAAKEARQAAEKVEAEERRRQDKLDMEERARRDKEEARARTQELLLLIGALLKKD